MLTSTYPDTTYPDTTYADSSPSESPSADSFDPIAALKEMANTSDESSIEAFAMSPPLNETDDTCPYIPTEVAAVAAAGAAAGAAGAAPGHWGGAGGNLCGHEMKRLANFANMTLRAALLLAATTITYPVFTVVYLIDKGLQLAVGGRAQFKMIVLLLSIANDLSGQIPPGVIAVAELANRDFKDYTTNLYGLAGHAGELLPLSRLIDEISAASKASDFADKPIDGLVFEKARTLNVDWPPGLTTYGQFFLSVCNCLRPFMTADMVKAEFARAANYIKGQEGGRSKAKSKKDAAKWVSTGRQTTLKDGSKRTVYRNSKTGARATKRMVERNGKRTAKYVKA